MGFWSFLLLVVLILCGVMFYHRLQAMEREIRAELDAKAQATQSGDDVPQPHEPAGPAGEPITLESQILSLVQAQPGIIQTELYDKFPDVSRKGLQQMLRELDRQGRLKREKEKGSYRLFVT